MTEIEQIRSEVLTIRKACTRILRRLDTMAPVAALPDVVQLERRPAIAPADTGAVLFNRFWDAYPRRTGKQAARRAWAKVAPDVRLLALMLRALEIQGQTRQWQQGVIPHPATWLNGRRWEDEAFDVVDGPNGADLF